MPHGNIKAKKKKRRQERHTGGTDEAKEGETFAVTAAVSPTTTATYETTSSLLSLQSIQRQQQLCDFSDNTPAIAKTTKATCTGREDDHHDDSSPSSSSSSSSPRPTSQYSYSQYKEATEQFKLSLLQLAKSISSGTEDTKSKRSKSKSNIKKSTDTDKSKDTGTNKSTEYTSVQQMLDAVDCVYQQVIGHDTSIHSSSAEEVSQLRQQEGNNIKVRNGNGGIATDKTEPAIAAIDPQMMMHLKTAISIRRFVMKYHHDGGDEGHRYYYKALLYCWDTLRRVIKFQQLRMVGQGGEGGNYATDESVPLSNRFGLLSMMLDEGCDEKETNEDDQQEERPPRPEPPKTFENDDAYVYVGMFLTDIDQKMGCIAKHYQRLKETCRKNRDDHSPSTTAEYVKAVLEGSVMVNFFIQRIKEAEVALSDIYPYLSNIYRVIVYLHFDSEIIEFTEKVKSNLSSTSSKMIYTTHETIKFFGVIVEAAFRADSSKLAEVTFNFCKKWKIPISLVARDFAYILFTAQFEDEGEKSYLWLSPLKYIGGSDRNIMHTVRLLQMQQEGLRKVSATNETRIFRRGQFGEPWDEERNCATKILSDMDDFLMCDVLPTLQSMCTEGKLATVIKQGKKMQKQTGLLSFFSAAKFFFEMSEESLQWSFVFGVHALLTSVFEMQGQNDLKNLSTKMKATFEMYIYQIDSILNSGGGIFSQSSYILNLYDIQSCRELDCRPVISSIDDGDGPQLVINYELAIWNPLCSGQLLEYICFYCNIDVGMQMIDSYTQLRIVLHTYNALIQRGALVVGDVEFIDWLFDTFKNCNFIWQGSIPQQGEFVERLWIALGALPHQAKKKAVTTHTRIRELISDDCSVTSVKKFTGFRKSLSIDPSHICTSYRRICFHDFTDVQDRRATGEKRTRCKCMICDTFYHMIKEQRILGTNFALVGCRLYDFVGKLCSLLGSNQELSNTMCSGNPILGIDSIFEEILGVLDVVRNLNQVPNHGESDCSFARSATLFMSFFNGDQFQTENIAFFLPNASITVDDMTRLEEE